LSRYLVAEIVLYSALGLLAVEGVLVLQNTAQHLVDLSGAGPTFGEIGELVGLVSIQILAYALPIAFLAAVMATLGRMATESELSAMHSLGVSFAQVTLPIVVLGLVATLATSWLIHEAQPASRRNLLSLFGQIAGRGGFIQPETFIPLDRARKRFLMVDRRAGNRLGGVLLLDHTRPGRPLTITAEEGTFSYDAEALTGNLILERGEVHFAPSHAGDDKYKRIGFDRFDYPIRIDKFVSGADERLLPKELRTSQMLDVLDYFDTHGTAPPDARVTKRRKYAIQLHRRLNLGLSPILFAFLAVPLGSRRRARAGRSHGVAICVALTFGYYAVLTFFVSLVEDRPLPMAVLWIPNVALLMAGFWLHLRARRVPR